MIFLLSTKLLTKNIASLKLNLPYAYLFYINYFHKGYLFVLELTSSIILSTIMGSLSSSYSILYEIG